MTAHEAALWFAEHYANDTTPENNVPALCECGHWEFMESASFEFGDDPICEDCAIGMQQAQEVKERKNARQFVGRKTR